MNKKHEKYCSRILGRVITDIEILEEDNDESNPEILNVKFTKPGIKPLAGRLESVSSILPKALKKKYDCSECVIEFDTEEDLTKHLESIVHRKNILHHKTRCATCDLNFISKAFLKLNG